MAEKEKSTIYIIYICKECLEISSEADIAQLGERQTEVKLSVYLDPRVDLEGES